MKIEPIFGDCQRDGRNAHGRRMFKCLREGCSHRSSWQKREHGHSKLEKLEELEEGTEVLEEALPA